MMSFRRLRSIAMVFALVVVATAAIAADAPQAGPHRALATFAGGCFWCMEPPFEALPGVIDVTAGYTGGSKKNPTYEEVSSGTTGHAESVQILYDPTKITYAKLLDVYWHNIDPTVKDQQFCDHGNQYRTVIFVHDARQRALAEASKKKLEAAGMRVYTEIVPAGTFWAAEKYHQDYYKKNPIRYNYYRRGCGRDARLRQIWGDKAGGH